MPLAHGGGAACRPPADARATAGAGYFDLPPAPGCRKLIHHIPLNKVVNARTQTIQARHTPKKLGGYQDIPPKIYRDCFQLRSWQWQYRLGMRSGEIWGVFLRDEKTGLPFPLLKTENRLSRNLPRSGLRPALQAAVLRESSCGIGRESLLALDLSDIVKPYARKMEHLAPVHDGGSGGIGNGYWLCEVIGVEGDEAETTPLYRDLYSQKAPDFVSENDEILRAARRVSGSDSGRGIMVIDRGGGRGELYDEFQSDNVPSWRFLLTNFCRFADLRINKDETTPA